MKSKSLLLAVSVAFLTVSSALAQPKTGPINDPTNEPPPLGAILDLNGTPVTNSFQVYTVDFAAGLANTAITFAFRQDPSFSSFSDASVVDLTTSSGNLLLNGDFASGSVGTSTVTDWTYANIYGASYGGVLEAGCGVAGANCWYDGAVQAYDAISQTIATNIGDTYQISFAFNGGFQFSPGLYSDISTNGDVSDTNGNGVDVLAYAQAGLPAPGIPEPSSAFLLLGVVGAVALKLRKMLA